MTWVHQGVRNKFVMAETDDQSSDKFSMPIPPNPAPTKFAVGLRGATQQRNASDPSIGQTYSGRNCHSVTPSSTRKKTFSCLCESLVGFSRCFF